jgi:hypothetical protein
MKHTAVHLQTIKGLYEVRLYIVLMTFLCVYTHKRESDRSKGR